MNLFEKLNAFCQGVEKINIKLAQEWQVPMSLEEWHTPLPAPSTQPSTKPKPSLAVKKMQDELNYISQHFGKPTNLDPDGLLGAKTYAAMKWFASIHPEPNKLKDMAYAAKEIADFANSLKFHGKLPNHSKT